MVIISVNWLLCAGNRIYIDTDGKSGMSFCGMKMKSALSCSTSEILNDMQTVACPDFRKAEA
jgi:hypothetical protein